MPVIARTVWARQSLKIVTTATFLSGEVNGVLVLSYRDYGTGMQFEIVIPHGLYKDSISVLPDTENRYHAPS